MSIFNALWFASAVWIVAVAATGLVLGISSWAGVLTLAVAGVGPVLVARYLCVESEPSLSQSIQRELR